MKVQDGRCSYSRVRSASVPRFVISMRNEQFEGDHGLAIKIFSSADSVFKVVWYAESPGVSPLSPLANMIDRDADNNPSRKALFIMMQEDFHMVRCKARH